MLPTARKRPTPPDVRRKCSPISSLLIDGAIVAAMVSRDPGVADTAGLAAGNLFGPSKVKKAKRAGNRSELVAV
jgi:hypothetical protein